MRLQLRAPSTPARLALGLAGALLAGCAGQGLAPEAPGPLAARHDEGHDEGRGLAPNRLSLTLQQDFALVSGSDVCAKDAQVSGGFSCFRATSSQYHGAPLAGEGGEVSGVVPATTRLLAGIDRVLWTNWTLGLRGGVVIRGGGPKADGADAHPFLPLHGEARAAYWFGDAPFTRGGFRYGLFVAGGIAQVDAPSRVLVSEDTSKRRPAAEPESPGAQTLDAISRSGTSFVGGGASAACDIGPASSFFVHLKAMQLFPSDGTVLAPELGFEQGF